MDLGAHNRGFQDGSEINCTTLYFDVFLQSPDSFSTPSGNGFGSRQLGTHITRVYLFLNSVDYIIRNAKASGQALVRKQKCEADRAVARKCTESAMELACRISRRITQSEGKCTEPLNNECKLHIHNPDLRAHAHPVRLNLKIGRVIGVPFCASAFLRLQLS